jgi:hypothetical protein
LTTGSFQRFCASMIFMWIENRRARRPLPRSAEALPFPLGGGHIPPPKKQNADASLQELP